jgi:hypothetical protein
MRDGIGQMGAGQNDTRIAGNDLQHYTQPKSLLGEESERHQKSLGHQKHHVEKSSTRAYDSQHGGDTYKY